MKTLLTVLLTSALLGMSASAWADDGNSSDGVDKSAIISKDYQLGVPSKVLAQAGKLPVIKPVGSPQPGQPIKRVQPKPTPLPSFPKPLPKP